FPEFLPDLRVHGAERLVEQEHARFGRERAGNGDALPLPSGKLVRVASFQFLEAEQLEQFVNARLDVGPLPFLDLEAKGDVLEYIHVFEQRVILKDKADVALLDGELVDALAANEDVSLGRHFQAGNHAEHG